MNVLQRIFTDHADAYLESRQGLVAPGQRKVIDAIRQCRTGARGHHVYSCPDCKRSHVANSSCGDRHCPICQNEKAAQWVYRQQLRLLPCNYFMATFTLPEGGN
jgi:rubrerythrin